MNGDLQKDLKGSDRDMTDVIPLRLPGGTHSQDIRGPGLFFRLHEPHKKHSFVIIPPLLQKYVYLAVALRC
jgi:hypothetical protein